MGEQQVYIWIAWKLQSFIQRDFLISLPTQYMQYFISIFHSNPSKTEGGEVSDQTWSLKEGG